MKWAFTTHVANYMRRGRIGDEKFPSFWPSEASAIVVNEHGEEEVVGKCRRATFFRYAIQMAKYEQSQDPFLEELTGYLKENEKPTDQYMLWIWKSGEMYEDISIELAKNSGTFYEGQTPVYIRSHNISGKLDLIGVNPVTGKLFIGEMKSVYGHGADALFGRGKDRNSFVMGPPKDSNLMQIGLYHWHWADPRADYEESRLIYGARDTGRTGEYLVDLEKTDDGTFLAYRPIAPVEGKRTVTGISIESILAQYEYVKDHLERKVVPPKDFAIQFSDEKIKTMYDRGELGKGDSERVEKRLAQIEAGAKKINKQIEKGNWNCSWCQWSTVCYPKPEQDLEESSAE